jgi:hypothetical protein
MLEWLQFKYNDASIDQDCNTRTRMDSMSIPCLLRMFGSTA